MLSGYAAISMNYPVHIVLNGPQNPYVNHDTKKYLPNFLPKRTLEWAPQNPSAFLSVLSFDSKGTAPTLWDRAQLQEYSC